MLHDLHLYRLKGRKLFVDDGLYDLNLNRLTAISSRLCFGKTTICSSVAMVKKKEIPVDLCFKKQNWKPIDG